MISARVCGCAQKVFPFFLCCPRECRDSPDSNRCPLYRIYTHRIICSDCPAPALRRVKFKVAQGLMPLTNLEHALYRQVRPFDEIRSQFHLVLKFAQSFERVLECDLVHVLAA